MDIIELLITGLRTFNDLLTAGVAITAFSMLLYALSFNLRDRVARSFAILLTCLVVIYVAEALSSVAPNATQLELWMKLQWPGIIFLPPAYLHLSDAILETTGKPSRGRRRLAIRLTYLFSLAFLSSLPFSLLVGNLVMVNDPAPYLQRTWLTWVFTGYYVATMCLSAINFVRAYRRTVSSSSRRRMTYLLAGAVAPALGSYPYLLFGFGFAAEHRLLFWASVTLSNLLVNILLVIMAYAVAFFGVPWPDRVVKRRLFKWLMRGPVTASTVLALTTILRRAGVWLDRDVSAIVPVTMVASILIFEHLITLVAPVWERWLFWGKDAEAAELLQKLDERLLTQDDLQQFIEAVLAALCDRMQCSKAFLATIHNQEVEKLITSGGEFAVDETFDTSLLQAVAQNGVRQEFFSWGDFWLTPLFAADDQPDQLLGILGVEKKNIKAWDEEQYAAYNTLVERAQTALRDRHLQQQAFSSLEAIAPQIDRIQSLRAASRYDGTEILSTPDLALEEKELSPWVKEALSHYWGGPKLTESPLLNLSIVQRLVTEHNANPTNALRAILRFAIQRIKPEGEQRFTAEWILYNILEMKFLEGRKVREIAMRLAMSEADLYRKQRVAIEAVARAIVDMEKQSQASQTLVGILDSESDGFQTRGGLNG